MSCIWCGRHTTGCGKALGASADCLAIYSSILAGTAPPDVVATCTMATAEIRHLVRRYGRRAGFLETGVAAAIGDHEGASAALTALDDDHDEFDDLAAEHDYLLTYARILCAEALCDDDLHVRSVGLWDRVIRDVEASSTKDESADNLRVLGGIGYARFCIETGRLDEAEPWLRRVEARAQARGWELATARAQLERGAASWSAGDRVSTEARMYEAYPVIARYARANDVSRCWLFFGLTRMSAGGLKVADECWENAERHWRELGKPLHIHRIILQRSWIAIFRGRYAEAAETVTQARACLDSSPRSSWLAYARLDDHLGNVWRAEALADLGFDGAGRPEDSWEAAEERYRSGTGIIGAEPDAKRRRAAMEKLERAAELKVPASLAVDSVRYSVSDAEARAQWATCVSAPLLASAFAVALGVGELRPRQPIGRIPQRQRNFHCRCERRRGDGVVAGVDCRRSARRRRRTRPGRRGAPDHRRYGVHPLGSVAATADGSDHGPGAGPLPRARKAAVRPVRHRGGIGMGDVALNQPAALVLRFADVGPATYASLRVVGDPSRTVTWVVRAPIVREALDELGEALPEPKPGESVADAVSRALVRGPFASLDAELGLARRLGAVLLSAPAWRLLGAGLGRAKSDGGSTAGERSDGGSTAGERSDGGSTAGEPRAVVHVSPSARLGRVPWGLLAMPITEGSPARRLVELVDVLMAIPPNIANAPRPRTSWADRRRRRSLLDPRPDGCPANVPTRRWARCWVGLRRTRRWHSTFAMTSPGRGFCPR